MSKARLTDYTGAEIRPDVIVSYAARRGNRVTQVEATVLKTLSRKSAGRVTPILKVRPTGRESGISGRKTVKIQTIGAEHAVVIGDAPQD
ncbi:hypothetical protein [Streptomyces sp. NPDC006638]|uniref:hypothetical protein n=1 Tax=Streptomyces sp. NPDC006638 TaxID=3157183 RepID=UPI0033BAC028